MTCGSCQHWHCITRHSPHGWQHGQCRRYPPQVISRDTNISNEPQHYWPVVGQHDWCGEFKAKLTPGGD